jgi:hypothetical protein
MFNTALTITCNSSILVKLGNIMEVLVMTRYLCYFLVVNVNDHFTH